MSLTTLPLAEALLVDVRFNWEASRCILSFKPDDLEMHVLVLDGVSELHVPCQRLLGPSAQLVRAQERGHGLIEIELLSGDVIRIAAQSWEFRKERRSAPRD